MGDLLIVKFALTILCSLMFLAGQVMAPAAPGACAGRPAHHCCHAGTMPCCAASPSSVPQPPVTATVPTGSQIQILSPVPATVVWVIPTAATASISPVVTVSPKVAAAPLFARHCAWLI